MKEICIINFDGLHGSGKGTQILLLEEQLKNSDVSVLVRRGDGMRSGTGEEVSDPYSLWWQQNILRMRQTGIEGSESMAAATESSNRLNAELYLARKYFLPNLMRSEGNSHGAIILDRGPISRLFVKRREDGEADFDSIKFFENKSGKHTILLPDIVFLLHAPLDVLLKRNSERVSVKSRFREEVLKRFYPNFEGVISSLPNELKEITTIIDSTQTVLEINNIVRQKVSSIIGRTVLEGKSDADLERI